MKVIKMAFSYDDDERGDLTLEDALRLARLQQGQALTEMAEKFGISEQNLQDMEDGTVPISVEVIDILILCFFPNIHMKRIKARLVEH